MNATVRLYDPTGVPMLAADAAHAAARTVGTLAGKVVGFIDNSKPNFSDLVDDIAELLRARHGVAQILRHRKRAASIPADGELVEDFARRCDLVVTGSGD